MTRKPVVSPPSSSEQDLPSINSSLPVRGTFRLGSIVGIPIYMHVLTVLILSTVSVVAAVFSGLTLVLFILGVAGSLLFHEVGHALVARRHGYEVHGVVVYPFQSVVIIHGNIALPHEMQIALGGPVINALIALLLWSYLCLQGGFFMQMGALPVSRNAGATCLFFVNAAIAIGNLLPAFPLDGGQYLRAFLQGGMERNRAIGIIVRTSLILCLCLTIMGYFFKVPILEIFAFLIFLGTMKEVRLETARAVLNGAIIEDAMFRDFKTVSTGDRIGTVSKLMLSSQQSCFPVVCGEEVIGILSAAAIHRTLKRQGESAYVSEAMDKQFLFLPSTALLETGVLRLHENRRMPVLVMDGETLVGMLTEDSLRRFLEVRSLSSPAK